MQIAQQYGLVLVDWDRVRALWSREQARAGGSRGAVASLFEQVRSLHIAST